MTKVPTSVSEETSEPVPALVVHPHVPKDSQVLGAADESLEDNGAYKYPMAQIYVMELQNGEVARRIPVHQDGLLSEKPSSNNEGMLSLSLHSTNTGEDAVTEKFVIASGYNLEDADSGTEVFTELKPEDGGLELGTTYLVDYYALQEGSELVVSANNFAGYYYIEANTLFRRAADGKDVPAQFVIPRGKVQSNFTFTMAGSGDPSTFSFEIDAFPDYTIFDNEREVLFALQIAEQSV